MMVIAASAKLRALANFVESCTCPPLGHSIECQNTVERGKLARLVLTLETALTTVMAIVEDEQEPPLGATLEATIAAHAALAAVEELNLTP